MIASRSKLARRAGLTLLVVVAYGYGVWSHKHRLFPTPNIERGLRHAVWWFRPERGERDTSARQPVPCSELQSADTAVLLTLGQSNAANEGSPGYAVGANVYNFNFFDGRCYVARDPLLGATGNGGSVWTRLADKLIAAGRYRRVVIAPIAVGGTGIRRWTHGGDLHARIGKAIGGLASAGLEPTVVLWHQGENDARGMKGDEYIQHFAGVLRGIRDAGSDAPVYVAVASICGNAGSDEIRAAQREIPQRFPGVRPGPNTDELDRFRWRRDLCHFSAEGLERHAALWLEVLTASR